MTFDMTACGSGTRNGFVLPATLLAVVVIGAIVTGGFYMSSQEQTVSASSDLGGEAFEVAEYGLQEVMGNWKNREIAEAARIRKNDPTAPLPAGEAWAGSRLLGTYTIAVDSLGSRLFLVRTAGTVSHGLRSTTRTVGAMLRTTRAELPYKSAMTVLGDLSVEGNSSITGTDGCDAANAVPGVSAPTTANVTESGQAEIEGEPLPVQPEPAMTEATLSQFGDVTLEDMIKSATKIYAPGANPTNMAPETTTDGSGNTICDIVQNNWGDRTPGEPCSDYYPIIYGEGDLTLNGSGSGATGQGVLIVEGDLEISGNVTFHGVVITKGDLYYSGNGGHVEGSVIVMGDGSSTSAGSAGTEYNSCYVEEVFNGTLRARSLDTRWWVDLSGTAPLPTP